MSVFCQLVETSGIWIKHFTFFPFGFPDAWMRTFIDQTHYPQVKIMFDITPIDPHRSLVRPPNPKRLNLLMSNSLSTKPITNRNYHPHIERTSMTSCRNCNDLKSIRPQISQSKANPVKSSTQNTISYANSINDIRMRTNKIKRIRPSNDSIEHIRLGLNNNHRRIRVRLQVRFSSCLISQNTFYSISVSIKAFKSTIKSNFDFYSTHSSNIEQWNIRFGLKWIMIGFGFKK